MPADRDNDQSGPSKRPLQFGLRSLLALTAVVALFFGVLRWFEVPPLASAVVLLILCVGAAAALGLVAAIAASGDEEK